MISTADINHLKSLQAQAKKKGGPKHASQLSEADREVMRRALAAHIANGTATPKMLQLSKIHGISI